jgi:predicted DNA-binding transcriptional regulator YafY
MPSRLRRRVEAVRDAPSVVPGAGTPLDLSVLGAVAAAIRGHERARFGYTKPGAAKRRATPNRNGW